MIKGNTTEENNKHDWNHENRNQVGRSFDSDIVSKDRLEPGSLSGSDSTWRTCPNRSQSYRIGAIHIKKSEFSLLIQEQQRFSTRRQDFQWRFTAMVHCLVMRKFEDQIVGHQQSARQYDARVHWSSACPFVESSSDP